MNQMYEGLQYLSELVGTNEWKAVGEALDKFGNVVEKNSPECHIFLEDFIFKG